jgi:hypothetical protein
VDIYELDIAVNAVATAVKDFFFKRLPPILDDEQMSEMEAISSKNNTAARARQCLNFVTLSFARKVSQCGF